MKTEDYENRKYRLHIFDRSYTGWSFLDTETNEDYSSNESILKSISPLDNKLFNKDIFKVRLDGETSKIDVVYSYVRTVAFISGVLMLENNKTFGRTQNKKRLLYKCVPNDKHLPAFLIPYDLKVGFSKTHKNKYVVFKYDNWDDTHPHGILTETIGDVDKLEAFYEYQLYCKSLHYSLVEFSNKTKVSLNKKNNNDEYIKAIFENPNFKIEDRREKYIFTIDPTNSLDFDDGFGIEKVNIENREFTKVSVYIANVFLWLETLGLWNSFSQRVATIYLPDRRRPMLPTVLSDSLCSLQEDKERFAVVMDFIIDSAGNISEDYPVNLTNVFIKVKKNYRYEDPKMINKDDDYKCLMEVSKRMDSHVKNSHDIVAHWMVTMNSYLGIMMAKRKMGIFRSAFYINTNKGEELSDMPHINEDSKRFIKMWNNSIGHYVLYSDDSPLTHEMMTYQKGNGTDKDNGSCSVKSYIHITSPIRRLIDLLNQMIMLQEFGLVTHTSSDANQFLSDWINKLEYINTSMRSIRKLQTDCETLNRCSTDPNIMETTHDGILFDKVVKTDGIINYMVYLEKIKLLTKVITEVDMENYSYQKFKLFLFEDEDKVKKKIRVQLAGNPGSP